MKARRLFSVVETHTGGQPTRTITGGLNYIPGGSIVDKMAYLKDNMDWVRTALMYEPRGSAIMSGVILTEPTHPEADYGIIFIETGGYLPMCGHDTIGVCTALVETGMVEVTEPETRIILDTPAGLLTARVAVEDGRAKSVTFRNIPSFAFHLNATVSVPTMGDVHVDLAYGGNVYAIVKAEEAGLDIAPENAGEVIAKGRLVRDAVNAALPILHPDKPFVDCCTHTEFYGPPRNPEAHVQNAVFFAEGGIDRSPCGTGTSAKVAVLYAKGELALGEEFVHESIIGSIFRARAVEETMVGGYKAIVPEVTGSANIMALNQIIIDPEDPHAHGFLLE